MKPTSNIAQAVRIGSLDKRVELQYRTYTPSGSGERVETWNTLANVWASVEEKQVGSQEEFERKKLTAVSTTVFTIRYRADVTTLLRIVYNGLNYDIQSVIQVGRKQHLLLEAVARL